MAKKTKSILIQIAVISLISIVMGEIALRLYNNYHPSFIFYTGSYNRFRGKPFGDDWDFKLNSQGFKDKEFITTAEKPENLYRILGIGDSFSFGVVPYKNNYLTLIESQFNLENLNVEIFNMGIPSIGPKDYLALLVREGLNLEPDMVLLSFFIGNDFEESNKRKLYEYSYIASFFHYLINLQPKYNGTIFHGKAEYCDDCPTFDHDKYLDIEYRRSYIYLKENNVFLEQQKNAFYYLKEIKNICNKYDIKLVVVIIPDELQINQELQRQLKEIYYPNVDLDMAIPNRMLSNELQKLNIDYIDLYEDFLKSSQRLYRTRDTHWNIAGNQLAASVIQKYIAKYVAD